MYFCTMKNNIFAATMIIVTVSACSRDIDKLCRRQFPDDGPAASVLVMQHDSIIYEGYFGYANLETGERTTPESLFCLASISKQFTAAAILQMQDRGLLSVNDPVRKYIPELKSSVWDSITISHLLSHSSGIPDNRRKIYTLHQRIDFNDSLTLEYLYNIDTLNFKPGEFYEYINPTFVLAGHILEVISGQDLNDYMRENIFDKAGMKNSVYFDAEHQDAIPSRVYGYDREDKRKEWTRYDYGQETCFATRADGALYSNVREYASWFKALKGGKIISESALNDAWTPHIQVAGSPFSSYCGRDDTYYGYGFLIECPGQEDSWRIYHRGGNGGFHNIAAWYPKDETLIVLLTARPDWEHYSFLGKVKFSLGK